MGAATNRMGSAAMSELVRVCEQSCDSLSMIVVSPLAPDDWRIWRSLRLQALAEAPHAFCSTLAAWTGARDLEERWRARLTQVPFNAVACCDGADAGMIGATAPDANGRAELLSMWVAPPWRGRGVGDALVAAVCEWAAAQDADVLLPVYDDNAAAIRMYERNGFARTGAVEISEDGRRELLMLRRR